jgi:hypothetical protein
VEAVHAHQFTSLQHHEVKPSARGPPSQDRLPLPRPYPVGRCENRGDPKRALICNRGAFLHVASAMSAFDIVEPNDRCPSPTRGAHGDRGGCRTRTTAPRAEFRSGLSHPRLPGSTQRESAGHCAGSASSDRQPRRISLGTLGRLRGCVNQVQRDATLRPAWLLEARSGWPDETTRGSLRLQSVTSPPARPPDPLATATQAGSSASFGCSLFASSSSDAPDWRLDR